ncbi:DUF4468 domain-containing protein [uncultured Hymenobacter sp.]|uniref:DUF4468 domain-containing protein n=1 Tax=uncultured Hymenobacter sp. TaxID=170016 RepID=UPI0035CC6925
MRCLLFFLRWRPGREWSAVLLLLPLLCAAPAVRGQALPLDEQGRVRFLAVVPADSLGPDTLYAHAKAWLRRRGYTLATADSAAGRLVAHHAVGVYDRGYLTRRLHGRVRYQLTVEVKPGRYRLQFYDFVFHYYQEDHASHLVPTGKTKPLEDATAPGWQKLWESHRQDTRQAVAALTAELRPAMLAKPAPPAPVPRPAADW